jgi:N-sulfoglucosamine sulfohydrolase
MDRIAREGVRFTRAFNAYPSCSPSRASILTGVFPHTHQVVRNVAESFGAAVPPDRQSYVAGFLKRGLAVPASVPTLPQLMNQAGYRTAISHKFHVLPHTNFPFGDWLHGDRQELERFFVAARQRQQPFFLMHNIASPHRPFAIHLRHATVPAVDPAAVKPPACLPDLPEVCQDWADYLRCIQVADQKLGEALEALRAAGCGQDTLVVVLGDNGPAFPRGKASTYPLGLRSILLVSGPGVVAGVTSDRLTSMVDIAPTLCAIAGIVPPAPMAGLSFRTVLAGQADAAGHALVVGEHQGGLDPGAFRERGATDGRWHYIRRVNHQAKREVNADDFDGPQWGNRTWPAMLAAQDRFPDLLALASRWKDSPPAEELYDLAADPGCIRDLIADTAHAADLRRMRAALDAWIIRTGDGGMWAARP